MTENNDDKTKNEAPRKRLTYGGAVFFTVILFVIGASFFGGKMSYEYGYPLYHLNIHHHPAGSIKAVMYGALSFLPVGLIMGLTVGLLGVGPLTAIYNYSRKKTTSSSM